MDGEGKPDGGRGGQQARSAGQQARRAWGPQRVSD
jgi:hypothetical protein